MSTWVALLRGVNVGGVTVRSADLAALFRELGFDEVKTVLASGNVRFATDASDRAGLKHRIERALGERFGYEAWIVLVTADELAATIADFPFDADDPARHPYAVFCSDPAVQQELADAAASLDRDEDPLRSGETVLYWNPQAGTTTSTAFAKMLARSRYKATTTTRNLRTLVKITL